jgi:SNF2 family DNA or RNA helicase
VLLGVAILAKGQEVRLVKGPTFRSGTKPFSHQRTELKTHGTDELRGLFWEMGTGKTKPVIDTFTHMYEAGELGGMSILAPNGVHRNWERNEIPLHMPGDLVERARVLAWQTSKARTQWFKREAEELLKYKDGPAVLLMSYDGLMTDLGAKFQRRFLDGRRCLYGADESQMAKHSRTKRTKRVLASSRYAPVRRILSGTLVDDSPFDVFAQLKFLSPGIWDAIGCRTFAAFKQQFGVWQEARRKDGKTFPHCVSFKNLQQLNQIVAQWGSRVLRDDVLDLPPKLYTIRYFDMTSEQARAYREIKEDFLTLLDDGDLLTAALAITRMLRLQQVTSGYLPSDGDEALRPLGKNNPRLKCLIETLEGAPEGHRLVWAKFREDIRLIKQACEAQGWSCVTYDGSTDENERLASLERFQRGEVDIMAANPAVGATGIDMTVANVIVFYNTTFKLGERLQAESRADRYGQKNSMLFVDLAAQGTIDEYIISALRRKLKTAALVMGDQLRAWL